MNEKTQRIPFVDRNIFKRNTNFYLFLGSQLKDLKKFEKAIECFNKCIEIDPNIRNFFLKKGSCLLELKRYDESLEFLTCPFQTNFYEYKSFLDLKNESFLLENLFVIFYN